MSETVFFKIPTCIYVYLGPEFQVKWVIAFVYLFFRVFRLRWISCRDVSRYSSFYRLFRYFQHRFLTRRHRNCKLDPQENVFEHSLSRTFSISNILHLEHSLSRTLPISNILHLKHSPSQTLPISNITYLEHSPSRTLPISNITYLEHSLSRTFSISNILYLKHSLSGTFSISNILYLEHSLSQTFSISNIL